MNKTAAAFVLSMVAMAPALADQPSTQDCPIPPPMMATHMVPPYPPLSTRLGEQGQTILQVTIAANGSVQDVTLAQSSGFERLDSAAVDYVKANWRWQPLLVGGCKSVSTRVAIRWTLKNGSSFGPFTAQDALAFITFLPMNPADYPADALAARQKGMVVLAVILSDKGEVAKIAIAHGSGVASLDAKALEIAKTRYHWMPARASDKPIGSISMIVMVWTLPGDPVPSSEQMKGMMELFMPQPQSAPPPPAAPQK